jgi:hypothetical protein
MFIAICVYSLIPALQEILETGALAWLFVAYSIYVQSEWKHIIVPFSDYHVY